MLQIPFTIIPPRPITSNESNKQEQVQRVGTCSEEFDEIQYLTQEIISKRSQIQTITSQTNLPLAISTLEDYLNSIYELVLQRFPKWDYTQVTTKVDDFCISSKIPWKVPFISPGSSSSSFSSAAYSDSSASKFNDYWSLSDEIKLVMVNLSIGYQLKANELVDEILDSKGDYKEDNRWIQIFKLFKKSLTFINFLKSHCQHDSNTSNIWELSRDFVDVLNTSVKISIQSTFLIKSLLILSNFDYDIDDALIKETDINYSTMARISIFIKTETTNLKTILTNNFILRQNKDYERLIVNFMNINEISIGIFLGVEFYKKDDLGNAIGALNHSIDLITSKNSKSNDDDTDEDSKLKQKFSRLKIKLNSKSNNSIKPGKKLKINKSLLSQSQANPSSFLKTISLQFQLIEILNYKFELQNNALNFQAITPSREILMKWQPMGRSVPITETNYWKPDFITAASASSGKTNNDIKRKESEQYY